MLFSGSGAYNQKRVQKKILSTASVLQGNLSLFLTKRLERSLCKNQILTIHSTYQRKALASLVVFYSMCILFRKTIFSLSGDCGGVERESVDEWVGGVCVCGKGVF